jgi:phage portal protein BeeE
MLEGIRRALDRWIGPSDRVTRLESELAGLRSQIETKSVEGYARLIVPPSYSGGGPPNPAAWTENKDELIRRYKGPVYVAVGAIAKRICAQTPIVADRRKRKSGEKLEPITDHPLAELLEHPNNLMPPWELWFLTIAWRLLTGDSYWWIARNGFKLPSEIWPLPPPWVRAVPSQTKFVGSYEVTGVFARDPVYIDAADIVHMREPNVDWNGSGRFYGGSVLKSADNVVASVEAIVNRQYAHFKSFVPTGLHFHTDKELTEDQLKQHYAAIQTMYRLAERDGRPIVTHANYQVSEWNKSPREMDYMRSLDIGYNYILSMFGVSKTIAGLIEGVQRANYYGSMVSFNDNVVAPLLVLQGQYLTLELAREFDENLVVYYESPRVDDVDRLRADIQTAIAAGAVTPNEIRELMLSLPSYQHGGDRPIIGGAEGPVGNADENVFEQEQAAQQAMAGAAGFGQPPGQEPAPGQVEEGMDASSPNEPPQEPTKALTKELPDFATQGEYGMRHEMQTAWLKTHGTREQALSRALAGVLKAQKAHVVDQVRAAESATPGDEETWLPEKTDAQLMRAGNAELRKTMTAGAQLELRMLQRRLGKAYELISAKAKTKPLELSMDMEAAVARTVAEQFSSEWWTENVGKHTRANLRKLVEQSVEDGWSTQQLADAIEEDHPRLFDSTRALRIARSESTAAINGGQALVREDLGDVVDGQEWLSTLDEATRESHAEADGQIVDVGKPFTVGGYDARWPGDPNLPPEERINCRCASASYVSTEKLLARLQAKHAPTNGNGHHTKAGLLQRLLQRISTPPVVNVQLKMPEAKPKKFLFERNSRGDVIARREVPVDS